MESGRRKRGRLAALGGVALLGISPAGARGEEPFAIQEVPVQGRALQAELVDLDGDGRADLLSLTAEGMPPAERRRVGVHFQRADGALPAQPDWVGPLADDAAAYDLAELDGEPGLELLLLRRTGVRVVSLRGRRARVVELSVPQGLTVAAAPDERNLTRLRLARQGLGEGPRLLVPGFGETFVLDRGGALLGRLEVGSRATYLVPRRPGPLVGESEIEVYFDHPRLAAGDVDGDGRLDVLSSTRHELRVFLQRPDGRFPAAPDHRHALGRLSARDHARRSGSVRLECADLDGDGRADLLVAHASGSFFDGSTELAIHLNRGGSWDLQRPDQRLQHKGAFITHQLLDLDAEGRPELAVLRISSGVLDVVELLLTRAVDAELTVHRLGAGGRYEVKPWQRRALELPLSFEMLRTRGFPPTLEADLNGDNRRDLLLSGGGEALQIYVGQTGRGFAQREVRQRVDTEGSIRFGDLERDGLEDFVIYDTRRNGSPLRVGRNRGLLPGTREIPQLRRLPTPDPPPAQGAAAPLSR
jgi:hypothetical protein